MRVLVCGGRDFDDLPLLGDALERVHAWHVITLLIHGGAQGADTAAHHWAGFKRVPVQVFHEFGSGGWSERKIAGQGKAGRPGRGRLAIYRGAIDADQQSGEAAGDQEANQAAFVEGVLTGPFFLFLSLAISRKGVSGPRRPHQNDWSDGR
jgi:hypothetical protein